MKGGTMYKQKDIVIIPFPYSDLTGSKLRPALILSNNKLNVTEDRICCLITSNKPKDSNIIINKSLEEGRLPFESWVKPQRLFTINERIIKKKLGTVKSEFYDKIIENVDSYIKRIN